MTVLSGYGWTMSLLVPLHQVINTVLLLSGKTLWSSLCKLDCLNFRTQSSVLVFDLVQDQDDMAISVWCGTCRCRGIQSE